MELITKHILMKFLLVFTSLWLNGSTYSVDADRCIAEKNEKIWSIIDIERALRKHVNTYVPLDCPLWSSFLPPLGNTVMSTFFLLSITCSDF